MLRQPLIPAYVLAGLTIGPLVLGFVKNLNLIYAFSEIGIAFLLFTAGLEISFKKIKEQNPKIKAILTATRISEALELYEKGADYVILPKIIAGEEILDVIHLAHKGGAKIQEAKKRHLRELGRVHRVLY